MTDRTVVRAVLAAAISLTLVLSFAGAALAGPADHPVVGRWVVEAEPGGAVWTFQPLGAVIALGPGEILSEGSWEMIDEEGAFDATIEVGVTGQTLQVLGQVSPEGKAAALYVVATEATNPDDWTPWPPESRLVGYPMGMLPDETAQPTAPPLDCLRPEWIAGAVDWDRCDAVPAAE